MFKRTWSKGSGNTFQDTNLISVQTQWSVEEWIHNGLVWYRQPLSKCPIRACCANNPIHMGTLLCRTTGIHWTQWTHIDLNGYTAMYGFLCRKTSIFFWCVPSTGTLKHLVHTRKTSALELRHILLILEFASINSQLGIHEDIRPRFLFVLGIKWYKYMFSSTVYVQCNSFLSCILWLNVRALVDITIFPALKSFKINYLR